MIPMKHLAVVFFFGGGWKNGTIKQFESQATITAETPPGSKHNLRPDFYEG